MTFKHPWSGLKARVLKYRALSYAQEGEDLILARLFGSLGNRQGFYVDVGAHHPHRYSNTYLFYKRGWRGVNIDAAAGVKARFDSARPGDINIESAISRDGRELTFTEFNDPAVNTCRAENVQWGLDRGFTIVRQSTLRTTTLAAILARVTASPQRIDFLTIDVEGMDLEVIEGNDWKRFRPTVVVVEAYGSSVKEALESPLTGRLSEVGYLLVAKTENTSFYRTVS